MSKIKVNEIEAQSGSTITIPTGQNLVVTDGLATSSLPTVPVTKGGTGLTSLGTAGQSLKVNSGGTALEFGTVGGNNTPSWSTYLSSNQTVSGNTWTQVQYNTEFFDTDNAYDNSSNYRFTVPSGKAGKYFVQFSVNIGGIGDNQTERRYTRLIKNGSVFCYGLSQDLTGDADAINNDTSDNTVLIDLADGDYLEIQAYHQTVSGVNGQFLGNTVEKTTRFSGFKLL